ncbi:hypothetical protein IB265_32755 [Ensifer sp. ENS10]|uniref:hypothetical protein n=1 Tax=Ensifer sp. ENS10 TaxID=2769286 RepID=UPI001780FEEB|nr:hypothetical protein [Ensifer sp. ENS10]MBD9511528.1 hypothetical protein [Ensifer sp. ENS10]
MSVALDPCPFCACEARIERIGDRRQSTIYRCDNCGCSLETGEEWGHGKGWNERLTRITDEMVERAAKALEKRIKQDTYAWTDEQFETWWNDDSRFVEKINVWGWFKGTQKEKCLHEARITLEAALS